MEEEWDIYDIDRKKTGKIAKRDDEDKLEQGEYHIIVNAVILNSKGEILLSRRAPFKKNPLFWECAGGSIKKGETSLEGMLRELKEELGLVFDKKEAIHLAELRRDKVPCDFKDLWLFKRDIDIASEVSFEDEESIDAKFVTIDKFEEMFKAGEIIKAVDFNRELYNKALKLTKRKSSDFLGKELTVEVERPLGETRKSDEYDYEPNTVNYGFIPNTVSGDGEEVDAYILGVDEPVKEFKGECIGVIYRIDDDDDKLLIAPEGKTFTDEEIRKLTNFQEQYFTSEIIRE